MPTLDLCREKIRSPNVFMSATLETVNLLGKTIYIIKGKVTHSNFVVKYKEKLSWGEVMFKPFFMPD